MTTVMAMRKSGVSSEMQRMRSWAALKNDCRPLNCDDLISVHLEFCVTGSVSDARIETFQNFSEHSQHLLMYPRFISFNLRSLFSLFC